MILLIIFDEVIIVIAAEPNQFALENLNNAADELIEHVRSHSELMANMSEMGRPRDDIAPTVRSFVVRPAAYIIFYIPIPEGIFVSVCCMVPAISKGCFRWKQQHLEHFLETCAVHFRPSLSSLR